MSSSRPFQKRRLSLYQIIFTFFIINIGVTKLRHSANSIIIKFWMKMIQIDLVHKFWLSSDLNLSYDNFLLFILREKIYLHLLQFWNKSYAVWPKKQESLLYTIQSDWFISVINFNFWKWVCNIKNRIPKKIVELIIKYEIHLIDL